MQHKYLFTITILLSLILYKSSSTLHRLMCHSTHYLHMRCVHYGPRITCTIYNIIWVVRTRCVCLYVQRNHSFIEVTIVSYFEVLWRSFICAILSQKFLYNLSIPICSINPKSTWSRNGGPRHAMPIPTQSHL